MLVCVCMSMCVHERALAGDWRGKQVCWILWSWSYKWYNVLLGLESEFWSSARITSSLNYWSSSPASEFFLNVRDWCYNSAHKNPCHQTRWLKFSSWNTHCGWRELTSLICLLMTHTCRQTTQTINVKKNQSWVYWCIVPVTHEAKKHGVEFRTLWLAWATQWFSLSKIK